VALPRATMARIVAVMTMTAITGSLLFNFTTNGNGQLLRERFVGIVEDPATLGVLLAAVYSVASLAQVVVGRLIDRYPLRRLYLSIVLLQPPLLALAAVAEGWLLLVLQTGFMIVIFGAIPFTDAMIVRYVDDRMRSRVTGIRLAISFGVSSMAVWMLGPVVKVAGFDALLYAMSGIALCTLLFAAMLPDDRVREQARAAA
jgi:MFS family permease